MIIKNIPWVFIFISRPLIKKRLDYLIKSAVSFKVLSPSPSAAVRCCSIPSVPIPERTGCGCPKSGLNAQLSCAKRRVNMKV